LPLALLAVVAVATVQCWLDWRNPTFAAAGIGIGSSLAARSYL
jgi:hypothetical protein